MVKHDGEMVGTFCARVLQRLDGESDAKGANCR